MKSKMIMLIGIPGSGKSTYAEKMKLEDYEVLSSDQIRSELFGNEDCIENNGLVFDTLHKRMIENIRNGKKFIYDATNINMKRRMNVLEQVKRFRSFLECECTVFLTPLETCYHNNNIRERHVPVNVIDNMFKSFQFPIKDEGWDKINLVFQNVEYYNEIYINDFNSFSDDNINFNNFSHNVLSKNHETSRCCGMSHDSSYHSFSVDRHIWFTYKEIKDKFPNNKNLQLAAMFHDCGKGICKNFKENARYANFYGHECISSYLASMILYRNSKNLKLSDDDIIEICSLISLHMDMHKKSQERSKIFKERKINNDLYVKLKALNEADSLAK